MRYFIAPILSFSYEANKAAMNRLHAFPIGMTRRRSPLDRVMGIMILTRRLRPCRFPGAFVSALCPLAAAFSVGLQALERRSGPSAAYRRHRDTEHPVPLIPCAAAAKIPWAVVSRASRRGALLGLCFRGGFPLIMAFALGISPTEKGNARAGSCEDCGSARQPVLQPRSSRSALAHELLFQTRWKRMGSADLDPSSRGGQYDKAK